MLIYLHVDAFTALGNIYLLSEGFCPVSPNTRIQLYLYKSFINPDTQEVS